MCRGEMCIYSEVIDETRNAGLEIVQAERGGFAWAWAYHFSLKGTCISISPNSQNGQNRLVIRPAQTLPSSHRVGLVTD